VLLTPSRGKRLQCADVFLPYLWVLCQWLPSSVAAHTVGRRHRDRPPSVRLRRSSVDGRFVTAMRYGNLLMLATMAILPSPWRQISTRSPPPVFLIKPGNPPGDGKQSGRGEVQDKPRASPFGHMKEGLLKSQRDWRFAQAVRATHNGQAMPQRHVLSVPTPLCDLHVGGVCVPFEELFKAMPCQAPVPVSLCTPLLTAPHKRARRETTLARGSLKSSSPPLALLGESVFSPSQKLSSSLSSIGSGPIQRRGAQRDLDMEQKYI
jgi:hypothetical protein